MQEDTISSWVHHKNDLRTHLDWVPKNQVQDRLMITKGLVGICKGLRLLTWARDITVT